MKLSVVWPAGFLASLLEIFGEPDRIELSVFQGDVRHGRAGMKFYPQYARLLHYRDPTVEIDRTGLLELYSEQLSQENPSHILERVIWGDFHAGEHLFSAEFIPSGLKVEVEYSAGPRPKELLDRLRSAVRSISGNVPGYEVRVIFS